MVIQARNEVETITGLRDSVVLKRQNHLWVLENNKLTPPASTHVSEADRYTAVINAVFTEPSTDPAPSGFDRDVTQATKGPQTQPQAANKAVRDIRGAMLSKTIALGQHKIFVANGTIA